MQLLQGVVLTTPQSCGLQREQTELPTPGEGPTENHARAAALSFVVNSPHCLAGNHMTYDEADASVHELVSDCAFPEAVYQ